MHKRGLPFPEFTLKYVVFSWKVMVLSAVVIGVSTAITLFHESNIAAIAWQRSMDAQRSSQDVRTSEVRQLQTRRLSLQPKISLIDTDLFGLTSNAVNVLIDEFVGALLAGDYGTAEQVLAAAEQAADEMLAQQDSLAQGELDRLKTQLSDNIKQIQELLGDGNVVPADAMASLENSTQKPSARLLTARDYVQKTGEEITRRRSEMDSAQKQIVVRKGQKKLYMYENGKEVYAMPVSIGRPGAATKSGEFSILDKLGTVWSSWRIWLPQWMGIYFAGSSENGIHGLPFDNAGHTYWKNDVGVRNITYGCVMPTDENMTKLYKWAEVGVPVAIVE